MKSVNLDQTEINEIRRMFGDVHENTIFKIISDNRITGVSASEIEEKIKTKGLKLSRQTIHSHLRELLKKHRIYKDAGRKYFPKSSPLNEVSSMSQALNDAMNFVLDPVFSLEPSGETSQVISELTNKLYTYPGFKINHDFKSVGPTPLDYLMNKVTGPILSKKYRKPSIKNQEKIEIMLYEFINRIGAYITYVFIESFRPITGLHDLTLEQRKELSTRLVMQTLPIIQIFNMFQYLISNLDLTEETAKLDSDNIFKLDEKKFEYLSNSYREIYPKMYEALENWQFHGRVFWIKLDTYRATIRDCNHIWEKFFLHKVGKCYRCRACNLVTEIKVDKNSSQIIKERLRDSMFA